jgi:hypothetical protein
MNLFHIMWFTAACIQYIVGYGRSSVRSATGCMVVPGDPARTLGNTNALKHGMYTEAALEVKKALRNLNREMKESLQEIDGG